MIQASTPIELIDWLSEHTIKSLNKNQIFFVKDLFNYKDNFAELKGLPWIWENVIKELGNMWLKYWEELNYLYRKTKNEKDDELNLSPFFVYNDWNYYLNSLCYIIFSSKNSVSKRLRNYFKENHVTFFDLISKKDFLSIRSLWKSCFSEITEVKYKILNYYWIDSSKKLLKLYELNSSKEMPFKQIDSLNLKDYILNFYNNLSELEKNVVLNRENWFKNSSFSRLHELWKNNHLSRERIRQYWVLTNSDLDFYLKYHSQYFERYIENLLKLNDDFEIRKFSEIEEFSQFSYEFISDILSKIFSSDYLFHKNDLSKCFFFLKRSRIWEIENFNFFDKIDKIFYKERKIDKTETLYNITKIWLWKNIDKKEIKNFEPITKWYLEYWLDLETKENKIIFPINKRDYPSLIINELKLYNKRIHFSKLYNKLKEKYSQYSWNKKTVHRVLQSDSDAVNVWPWLYIHKSKRPDSQWFETIVQIIEKYLEESKVKCATIDDIVKYVKKQKTVTDNSIKFYLMNNDKFINLWGWIYWLTSCREWKLMPKKSVNWSGSVIELIEKYLNESYNKCATTKDIIDNVKKEWSFSDSSIRTYLCSKKRNKNKLIKIWEWMYWLTSYREWKVVSQWNSSNPGTIKEIIEWFLEKSNDKSATISDIIKYVKKEKTVSEKSIIIYLTEKKRNKNKIINIWQWVYWLASYREWKPKLQTQKSGTIVDIIEKFLEETKDKCASTSDIINHVKGQRTASEVSIIRYLKKKKQNKNKFIRIWQWIYWLASYREWKPKIQTQKTETIADVIEKFLNESNDKSANIQDIIKHVRNQKNVPENSIRACLTYEDKFIRIWKWKYWLNDYREWNFIPQEPESVIDMIENYLEGTEDKCATTDNIIKYIKNQRTTSEKYIIMCLCSKKLNDNKFINIKPWIYWLRKYRGGILQKHETIIDIIEKYLNEKKDKCASTKDIVNYVKNKREVSEGSIKKYLYNKQKNKNKIMYIWKWKHWLTSYREWRTYWDK